MPKYMPVKALSRKISFFGAVQVEGEEQNRASGQLSILYDLRKRPPKK